MPRGSGEGNPKQPLVEYSLATGFQYAHMACDCETGDCDDWGRVIEIGTDRLRTGNGSPVIGSTTSRRLVPLDDSDSQYELNAEVNSTTATELRL
jgi:hypothetical protein